MNTRTTFPRPQRTGGLSARDEILARLSTALADRSQDASPAQHPQPAQEFGYAGADHKSETADLAKNRDMLVGRLEDYRATVHRTTPSRIAEAVASAVGDAQRVIAAPDVPAAWRAALPESVALKVADGGSARELDQVAAVITRAHTAIALTGTLALRASAQEGRRALTLIPDRHVVVVHHEDVVRGVPAGIARLGEDPRAAWTLVSGPSATSDIELERVEGVHGPRDLHVVLIEPEPELTPADADEAEHDPAESEDREARTSPRSAPVRRRSTHEEKPQAAGDSQGAQESKARQESRR